MNVTNTIKAKRASLLCVCVCTKILILLTRHGHIYNMGPYNFEGQSVGKLKPGLELGSDLSWLCFGVFLWGAG